MVKNMHKIGRKWYIFRITGSWFSTNKTGMKCTKLERNWFVYGLIYSTFFHKRAKTTENQRWVKPFPASYKNDRSCIKIYNFYNNWTPYITSVLSSESLTTEQLAIAHVLKTKSILLAFLLTVLCCHLMHATNKWIH